MSFSFEIIQIANIAVVRLHGKIMTDLDLEEIAKESKKWVEKNSCQVIFNLSELMYINSSGINFFMRTLTKARINNGELIFCNVQGNVSTLFKIAKLNEIYTIYPSEEEAVNHFKNK